MSDFYSKDHTYIMVERYDEYGHEQMTKAEYAEHKATLDRLEEEGLESRNCLLLYNDDTQQPYGYEIQRKEQQVDQVVQWLAETMEPIDEGTRIGPLARLMMEAGKR